MDYVFVPFPTLHNFQNNVPVSLLPKCNALQCL